MKPKKTRGEDRLQWAAERARTFLLHGERGDDNFADGSRIGVLAAIVSRRWRLSDDEAISLARRAFDMLVSQGQATCNGVVYRATPKLKKREPHEGINVVLRARQWRILGYAIPPHVADHANVKNLVRDDHTGNMTYEVLRD